MITDTVLKKTGSVKKKPSKKDVFAALVQVMDEIPQDSHKLVIEGLAIAINYFEPTIKKSAQKDWFSWLFQACSKDETRKVLNFVHVDQDNIVSTDGRRLHIMPNNGQLDQGDYDRHKLKEEDPGQYPNYKQILLDTVGMETLTLKESDITQDALINMTPVYKLPNGACFNIQLLKEALSLNGEGIVFYDKEESGRPIKIELKEGRFVILMPMREIR